MLTIEVRAEESKRRLQKFAAAIGPVQRTQLNRQASVALHASVIRTFQAQGATEGREPWARLKAGGRYVGTGRKRKDGSRAPRRFQTAYKVLQDTGALRASWVPLYDSNVAGVGAASVKGHADLAPVHEYGDQTRNLPARPMLPTENYAIRTVTQVYGLAIEKAARP